MKTKALLKSFAFCLIAICSVCANAQISTNELPPSFSSSLFSTRSSDVINLPVPDVAEALHEDSLFADANIPYRVGLPLAVSYNLQNSGHWQVLGDSVRVWRLQLHAAGAKAMTVSYDKFWIPEGAKFFIYNADKTFCIGAFTHSNNKGTREKPEDFATGFVAGDNIVLEYYEPIGNSMGVISLQHVVYIYKNILAAQSNIMPRISLPEPGESMSCNININCPDGGDYQRDKRSVVCIYGANGYACTGTLINNMAQEDYVLTADHCFDGTSYDAEGKSQVNQLIFYWNYESPTCANAMNVNPPSTAAAAIVANNPDLDFALLKLTEPIVNLVGYIPYYIGWSRDTIPATRGTCIHHPKGDIKKISIDYEPIRSSQFRYSWDNGTFSAPNTLWVADFNKGMIENGSSGSPLINQNHKLIGKLRGGANAICGGPVIKYYDRFDKSWNCGSVATRRLKDWLDPDDLGIIEMEARNLDLDIVGDNVVCDSAIYYVDKLPVDALVTWECIAIQSYGPVLQVDKPTMNKCQIWNRDYLPAKVDLKAHISFNDTIRTITRRIYISDKTHIVKGTYQQEACDFYGVSHPELSGSLKPEAATFVHQGCMVHVYLNGEYGRSVRFDNSFGVPEPLYWSYNGSRLDFQLPYGSGGIPFTFKIGGDGYCRTKNLLFFSYSRNANAPISTYSLKVLSSLSSNVKQIVLIPVETSTKNSTQWEMEVYNTFYGTKVCDVKKIMDSNYQLNTSGWTPGVYIIRVVVGDEVLTDKITVGK